MPAGHGSAEVMGARPLGFPTTPPPSHKPSRYTAKKSLLARLNVVKHDSDIIGTKYKQKRENGVF